MSGVASTQTPTSFIDPVGPLRAGEPLDVAAVDSFLKAQLPQLSGVPEVQQFPGGTSNLTYLFRYPDRELVLRRPPFGHKAKSAHDMVREAKVMQALRAVYPLVPEVVTVCEHDEPLGTIFPSGCAVTCGWWRSATGDYRLLCSLIYRAISRRFTSTT